MWIHNNMINNKITFLGPTNLLLMPLVDNLLQKTQKQKQQIDYVMIVCNHEKPVNDSIFNSYKTAPM